MKVSCKNVICKYYYEKGSDHCIVENTCSEYTTNKKKAEKKVQMCKDCKYCKRIYTNAMSKYHYECTYKGKEKLLLMLEERTCDCKL